MKHTIILLLFSCALFCCAPKHITKQTQVTSVVTICYQFSGKLSKAAIIANPHLTIQNNIPKWQIISCQLQFNVYPVLSWSINGDTFPKEAIDKLGSAGVGGILNVYHIKAVNKYNDTCYLPPIAVQLIP